MGTLKFAVNMLKKEYKKWHNHCSHSLHREIVPGRGGYFAGSRSDR